MNILYPFSKSTKNDFFSYFEDLPSVSVSKILSFLSFTDKLSAIQVFPSWEPHLCTSEAWLALTYYDSRSTRIKDRQEVCQCLRKYGKYIKRIRINFHYHVRTSGTSLLKKIATHCKQLRCLEIVEADFDADRPFKSVLESCELLKDISLVRPWVDWSHQDNIVALVTGPNHAWKLTELVAVPETAYPEYDFGRAIRPTYLLNLHTLKLKRSFLTEDMLLKLTCKNLRHLSIFQDEELPLDQSILYNESTWGKVLSKKEDFCFHVALRNIIMLRSCLPSQAPLRALILADLLASLTKGILDTITEKYRYTLESFVCTKSHAYESVEVEDKRLPTALLDLTGSCSKLKTLVYGFSISSATVLLVAETRRFICLDIQQDTISYKCEWIPSSNLTASKVAWLKECCTTVDRLEEEVSVLQGFEWTLSNESRDRKIQHYFKYF